MGALQPLELLGNLRSGYMPRSRSTPAEEGADTYKFLQLRDVEAGDRINWERLDEIAIKDPPSHYEVKDGDVLLPLKGLRLKAILVEEPPAGIIATGQWAILTPKYESINGEYLVWYLNHPRTIKAIERKLLRGSNIQFISIGDLRKFEIDVPPLERQKQIATVARLRRRERDLVMQLEAARDKLIDATTMRAATNI